MPVYDCGCPCRFMKEVIMYTDGACSGNPGPGGWGCILIYQGHEKIMSGFEPQTTNNQMELEGPIRGLSALKEPCTVQAYSDSKYVCDAFNLHWLESWKRKGWVRGLHKPLKNVELWQHLDKLCQKHDVHWHHVRGHADNEYNNRCDALATGEIAKRRKKN